MIKKVTSVKINDDMGYIDLYREESSLFLKKVDILSKIGYKNGFCARIFSGASNYVQKKENGGRLTDFIEINFCSKFIKYLPCTALRRINANILSAFFDELYVISSGLSSCSDDEFIKNLSLDIDIRFDKNDESSQKKIEMLQNQITMFKMAFAEFSATIEDIMAKSEEDAC